jgi:hypothetical protein
MTYARRRQQLLDAYAFKLQQAARVLDPDVRDFGDAIKVLPPELLARFRESFRQQLATLKKRYPHETTE